MHAPPPFWALLLCPVPALGCRRASAWAACVASAVTLFIMPVCLLMWLTEVKKKKTLLCFLLLFSAVFFWKRWSHKNTMHINSLNSFFHRHNKFSKPNYPNRSSFISSTAFAKWLIALLRGQFCLCFRIFSKKAVYDNILKYVAWPLIAFVLLITWDS